MWTLEVVTLSAILDRPHQDRFMWAEVVARIRARQFLAKIPMNGPQIENSGGEVADLPLFGMRHVARHRERFKVDLGSHDRATETGDHSVFQALDFMSKNQKI